MQKLILFILLFPQLVFSSDIITQYKSGEGGETQQYLAHIDLDNNELTHVLDLGQFESDSPLVVGNTAGESLAVLVLELPSTT